MDILEETLEKIKLENTNFEIEILREFEISNPSSSIYYVKYLYNGEKITDSYAIKHRTAGLKYMDTNAFTSSIREAISLPLNSDITRYSINKKYQQELNDYLLVNSEKLVKQIKEITKENEKKKSSLINII